MLQGSLGLLHEEHLQALLGAAARGDGAGDTRADNEHIGVDGFGYLVSIDGCGGSEERGLSRGGEVVATCRAAIRRGTRAGAQPPSMVAPASPAPLKAAALRNPRRESAVLLGVSCIVLILPYPFSGFKGPCCFWPGTSAILRRLPRIAQTAKLMKMLSPGPFDHPHFWVKLGRGGMLSGIMPSKGGLWHTTLCRRCARRFQCPSYGLWRCCSQLWRHPRPFPWERCGHFRERRPRRSRPSGLRNCSRWSPTACCS